MALAFAPFGKSLRIVGIRADEKTGRHLSDLGLVIGGTITLLSASGGSCIIRLKESRLALDRVLAMKIMVDEEK